MGTTDRWVVHKFGGTSLATAERYRAASRIVVAAAGTARQAVVVSAMAGVTDSLIGLASRASARQGDYVAELEALLARETELIGNLLADEQTGPVATAVADDVDDINDILRALWLMRAPPKNAVDVVSGYGEIWSARILGAYLAAEGHQATWLNARDVLVVRGGEDARVLAPVVDWEASRRKLDTWLDTHDDEIVIITGYVASRADGSPTTLGRNGSDYSASIFARLLDAGEITIWTDVDGVLSADPRQVAEARVLEQLSYNEAMELAYFGAKVIHPATMAPAVEGSIPIRIRNSLNPEAPGSTIHLPAEAGSPVKGLASIDGMSLVNLEGTGMIGVPGVAERLFRALRDAGVSVVLISQGSSEHSICFAIPQHQTEAARQAVEQAFGHELRHDQIQRIEVTADCTILAVVGDGMSGVPGIAAEFFGALAGAGVNVRAIAQGSSERNISVVIDGTDSTRALRAAHAGFYLSKQTLSIGLIGPGMVGATLLGQLAERAGQLAGERIDLRVRAIAGSSQMLLDEQGIELGSWKQQLADQGEPTDLDRLVDHVNADHLPHAVLIDCTASGDIAARYPGWLARGIHVITPNKQASSAPIASYRQLREAARLSRRHFLYETTVGAALPIIHTLRDLIRTGDEVLGIEGIFSGTLAYLFNRFDGSEPFSAIVRQAREHGYTEPDPRDDLSGMDVARKVVILSREIGLDLELTDVQVESLVPPGLEQGSIDEFLDRLAGHDDAILERYRQAAADGQVLRYVGRIDPAARTLGVKLKPVPATHPFARIQLTDNIVEFRTGRYHDNPLVVQGPGAGPDVTAGGVFSDLLRLASYLGAPA